MNISLCLCVSFFSSFTFLFWSSLHFLDIVSRYSNHVTAQNEQLWTICLWDKQSLPIVIASTAFSFYNQCIKKLCSLTIWNISFLSHLSAYDDLLLDTTVSLHTFHGLWNKCISPNLTTAINRITYFQSIIVHCTLSWDNYIDCMSIYMIVVKCDIKYISNCWFVFKKLNASAEM